jgi:hypothetical protein
MATGSTEIERLVREVLAELAAAPQPAAAAEKPAPPAVVPPPVAPSPVAAVNGNVDGDRDGELTVGARVVTMNEVIGRLAGLRRVVVSPEAVVTPAVRDELQRRNVILVREAPSRRAAGGALRLVLIVHGKGFDAAPLVDVLGRDGVAVEQQAVDCLIAATDRLAAEVAKPNTLGALLTPHWAAGLCLANRRPGVRAVPGLDAPAAAAATAAVGANVLLLDPGGGTMFQWKQMLGEFCRGGVRPCPEVFHKRLG